MKYIRNENSILTALTLLSTFLMGFIDAYTFLTHNGLFASAQTGNMVVLGVKLLEVNFPEVLFIFFLLSALWSEPLLPKELQSRTKTMARRNIKYICFFQMVFLLVLAVI